MTKSMRRSTNELEFQGQVITWLNANIAKHSGMGLDRATPLYDLRASSDQHTMLCKDPTTNRVF